MMLAAVAENPTRGMASLNEGENHDRALNLSNLYEIERQITENIQMATSAKLCICIDLAGIKMKELYKEAGLTSFKDYIRTNRIPLHYHTAHDYAKIGETFLKYRDRLDGVEYKEDSGLKKLLLLEDALRKYRGDQDLVFLRLKRDSYRNFQRFIAEAHQSARADCLQSARADCMDSHLSIAEECIIILPAEKELLWFDPDIVEWFESSEQLRCFKQHILSATQEFLINNHQILLPQ